MDLDMKWLSIMMIGIMVAGMGGMAMTEYQKSQCKLAYAQSTKTADEINKICK